VILAKMLMGAGSALRGVSEFDTPELSLMLAGMERGRQGWKSQTGGQDYPRWCARSARGSGGVGSGKAESVSGAYGGGERGGSSR